ncbi:MAG: hypothetical protein DSY96_07100 [SAR324 cluster bacterium]|uniref:Uncharacterized protein n=1 Tax=SAR324 cluster bacterium TaxID=2024889 RepID=A0A432G6P9_9DELT|nr:MAG: hypothetical protein DSY98_05790 [SAR324 cluster bacterium]RTZ82141.1 MAG: hypothetical protein DSY94_10940 [SAR324 cluster bacterium]RTZ83960.1 MAG: hypothetical protein DSY96_07100 [SAR324 cluster bacterium]
MLYKGVYARVENDIRVHLFIGVGLIIHGNKEAVKKYLKYFIILYTLVCTEKLTCFFGAIH